MTLRQTPPADAAPVAERSALTNYLLPLRALLDEPDVTELCINRPGELFVERALSGWQRLDASFASFAWCLGLGKLIASATHQALDAERPLLSASIPTEPGQVGERVQVVIPPATLPGTVALSIRRPATVAWTLADLAARGFFPERDVVTVDSPVRASHASVRAFGVADQLRAAVLAKRNILVAGATGSGKTTLTRALIDVIPRAERLISIEDAAELSLASHPNAVRLFYSKDGQGLAQVTARQLLAASLRLRPDRILLAELRGAEAYDYLRNVNSGHPGSITSIHASSCEGALEQLALLVRESEAGRALGSEDLRALIRSLVGVVVQVGRDADGSRRVVEVLWNKYQEAQIA